MRLGTKSVLFGAHACWLHPWFVARAWWKLYGFPWHPLLWLCFFVHDLGYIGKTSMDSAEGETHPLFGANIMGLIGQEWYDLALYHSRFYSKKLNHPVSRLCAADKLSFCLTPAWLYLPMVRATGELYEYKARAGKLELTDGEWHTYVAEALQSWVDTHMAGLPDTTTKIREHATA